MIIVATVAILFLAPIFIALLGFPLGLGVYVLIRQPFSEPLFNIASGAALASGGALLVLWLGMKPYRREVEQLEAAEAAAAA